MTEMIVDLRRELVRKYFIPLPKNSVKNHVKLAAGAFLLFLGLGGTGFFSLVGFIVLIWAGVGYAKYMLARKAAQPRATDQQMNDWLYGRVPQIVIDGKDRLNIHPTELGASDDKACLPFIGIPDQEDWSYLQARGQDGVLRFSAYKIMIVYLSNWRMPVYECILDMETGATVADSTKEYNLKQVDGMETVSDRVALAVPGAGNQAGGGDPAGNAGQTASTRHYTRRQWVNLVVSGRPAVSLMVGIGDGDALHTEGVSRSHIDGSIATLREYLRSHNHGPQQADELGLSSGSLGLPGAPPALGLEASPEWPR